LRWARYAVGTARYDKSGNRLERVQVRTVHNGTLGPPRVWSRENLVHTLESGYDVIVLPAGKNLDGLDNRRIRLLSLNREGYLRVDGGETSCDHLGDLPSI